MTKGLKQLLAEKTKLALDIQAKHPERKPRSRKPKTIEASPAPTKTTKRQPAPAVAAAPPPPPPLPPQEQARVRGASFGARFAKLSGQGPRLLRHTQTWADAIREGQREAEHSNLLIHTPDPETLRKAGFGSARDDLEDLFA
ncbi:MAG: hypothetical protein WDN46_24170 [Methylocella sp.]